MLCDHILRLRCALRLQYVATWLAAVPIRVRCAQRRFGLVASWVLCRPGDACRGPPARPGRGCPMDDRRRPADHGSGGVLDVANEPRYQPGPSDLAPCGVGGRAFDMLRSRKRGGLPLDRK